jgi:cardiolipin synthase (CMP-forming)
MHKIHKRDSATFSLYLYFVTFVHLCGYRPSARKAAKKLGDRYHPKNLMPSILNVANLLTVSRLVMIPAFVTAVYYHRFAWALIIFSVAAITDLLDGLMARALNQKTQLGAILDPMADKLLLVTAFIVLSFPGFTRTPALPFWLTAAAISRDVFIVLGALVINMATGFSRFRPSLPGKLNTFIQLTTIVLFLTANAFGWFGEYLYGAYYLTLGMAIFSGLHYISYANRLIGQYQEDKPGD